jgi:hypothetical protein
MFGFFYSGLCSFKFFGGGSTPVNPFAKTTTTGENKTTTDGFLKTKTLI